MFQRLHIIIWVGAFSSWLLEKGYWRLWRFVELCIFCKEQFLMSTNNFAYRVENTQLSGPESSTDQRSETEIRVICLRGINSGGDARGVFDRDENMWFVSAYPARAPTLVRVDCRHLETTTRNWLRFWDSEVCAKIQISQVKGQIVRPKLPQCTYTFC